MQKRKLRSGRERNQVKRSDQAAPTERADMIVSYLTCVIMMPQLGSISALLLTKVTAVIHPTVTYGAL